MQPALPPAILQRHAGPVPRYTSYPTAAEFHDGIGPEAFTTWLAALPDTLSLYIHIPFCHSLCWFCGCNTNVANRHRVVGAYLETLAREIAHLAALIGRGRRVTHMHWGGGTPNILRPDEIRALAALLRGRFTFDPAARFDIELDPRGVDGATIAALVAAGVSRVSLGVQDVNPRVQEAIGRVQPFAEVRRLVQALRAAGITAINLDLIYGLPHQDEEAFARTLDAAIGLRPSRMAIFGYAHVPWMKPHQRLIDEGALPDSETRARQAQLSGERLGAAGYEEIGLDHFALPDDSLALARGAGRLHRNFQGYTEVGEEACLGLGASAISRTPSGFAQNATRVRDYRAAVASKGVATARGVALTGDDRLRGAIIEQLMCALTVDPDAVARALSLPPRSFAAERARLASMAADGLVILDGPRITMRQPARHLVRVVAAVFDRYRAGAPAARHSAAV